MMVFRPTVSYVDAPSLVFVATNSLHWVIRHLCSPFAYHSLNLADFVHSETKPCYMLKRFQNMIFFFIFRVRTRVKLVQRPIYLDLSSMQIGQIRKIGRVKIFGDIFIYEGSQVTRGFNLEFFHFCRDSRLDWCANIEILRSPRFPGLINA